MRKVLGDACARTELPGDATIAPTIASARRSLACADAHERQPYRGRPLAGDIEQQRSELVDQYFPRLLYSTAQTEDLRVSLVPDFDGDLEAVLASLENVLLTVTSFTGHQHDERQSWWWRDLVLHGQPQAAVARIIAKVLSARGQYGRQFSHNSNYQHRPLCVITLDNADLDRLRAAITALDHQVAAGNEMLNSIVNICHLSLTQAAEVYDVLSLVPTGDTETLLAVIGDGEHDVVFTETLDDVYQTTITRIQAIWNRDPYLYDLIEGPNTPDE